jgi:hypothetical protein
VSAPPPLAGICVCAGSPAAWPLLFPAWLAAVRCHYGREPELILGVHSLRKQVVRVSFPRSVARRGRAFKQLLERDAEVVDQSPQVGQQVRA